MRLPAVGLVTLLLLALSQPAVSQVSDEQLIVPGQRIGRWGLDMTIGAFVEMNGPQNVIPGLLTSPVEPMRAWFNDSRDDIWGHRWSNREFAAATRGKDAQRVEYIFTWSAASRTNTGVGPGSTVSAVVNAYGRPTTVVPQVRVGQPGQQRLIFDEIGLAAVLDRTGVVDLMVVFRTKTAQTLWDF
jgi:hypothetical protein